MKRIHSRYQILLASFAVFILVGAALAQPGRIAPLFTEPGSLPMTPQQWKPWIAPAADVPDTLISATTALCDAGFADPRGCEYRIIEVGVGSYRSREATLVKVHGWVLPPLEGSKQSFGICWNGLVYPIYGIGDKADLRSDVEAVLKADADARLAAKQSNARSNRFLTEPGAVSHESLTPIKTCLLLRLGESKLAEDYWKGYLAGLSANSHETEALKADPFMRLARDWAWAQFDRAVCAHVRGDDRLALLDATALFQVRKAIDKTAAERGLERPTADKPSPAEMSYLTFLAPLERLLTDEQRRMNSLPPPPAPEGANSQTRIAALIRKLDNVAPSEGGLTGDPIVAALVKEGEAAIDPLLKTLDEDDRLTRSVMVEAHIQMFHGFIGTHNVALAAIGELLQKRFDSEEEIQSFWKRFKGVPVEERWYLMLADDKADFKQWTYAARMIRDRKNPTEAQRKKGESPPCAGESLRTKSNPSVTELIADRIQSLASDISEGPDAIQHISAATSLATDLTIWDRQNATPTLAALFATYRTFFAARPRFQPTATADYELANLTTLRNYAGDGKAFAEYAAWIQDLNPSSAADSWIGFLRPMSTHPDDPEMAAAAEKMFGTPGSPWLQGFGRCRLLRSDMIGVPAFQKRILIDLFDVTPVGKVQVDVNGEFRVSGPGFSEQGHHSASLDPLAPKGAKTLDFRVCDYCAWMLSEVGGMPRCELYWPVAERDRAVKACAESFTKYAERFKFAYLSNLDAVPRGSTLRTRMTFPALDHPATPDDVARGRAIFSLSGQVESRLVKAVRLPMRARWTALKDFPDISHDFVPTLGEDVAPTIYRNEGIVWQVEELFQNGKWERYYGFVGPYTLAKVPAAEIEFIADVPWSEWSNQLACLVTALPGTMSRMGPVLRPGDPLDIQVKLSNISGNDRELAREYVAVSANNGLSLRAGIELRLSYRSADDTDWKVLSHKEAVTIPANGGLEKVRADEEFASFSIHLNDWYDLTRPGFYHFEISSLQPDVRLERSTTPAVPFVIQEAFDRK